MDTTSRRPQLPALSYLDIEQSKPEEEAARNNATSQLHTRISATSPSHPLGPPPPYSHTTPHHLSSWNGIKSDAHTSESRRTSGEEIESAKQMSRQSLPSISEALGVDGQTPYTSSIAPVQSALQPVASSSPSPTVRRPYGMEPPLSQSTYGTNSTYQYSSFRQDSAGRQSYQVSDAAKPAYTHLQDSRPPLHLQTSPSSSRAERLDRYGTSPQHEQSSSHSAGGSMGPPGFSYGYASHPSRYAEPTPPSSNGSGPVYQPSSQHAPPHTSSSSSWKPDAATTRLSLDERYAASSPHVDTVKRHLDLYDLGAALNDVAQSSGIVLDFSRRYGDRMHNTARSGATLSTLPGMVEVDDMIHKSRLQLDALSKIREVIIAQQAAYEQEVADQRQVKLYRDPPPQVAENLSDDDPTKVGFAGAETKKRRGRAAPPGRCHSCNRAETPEWRRGPDGARTLCNACGLHYAKLTRKQTNASKSANVGSSNLRPKEA